MIAQSPPTTTRELNRVRDFLFVALALVWFSEMNFLGFQALSAIWARLWQVALPPDSQLTRALFEAWSIGAPAKGALCVMAILGLASRQPVTRNALYASMALVPPLNLAFPFRYQGFLPGPVTVATTLSLILWGSFFLYPERPAVARRETLNGASASDWPRVRAIWLGINAAGFTLMALLLLFWPLYILRRVLPCQAGLLDANPGQLSSLIHVSMACGTHYLAVAAGGWLGCFAGQRHPALARVMSLAFVTFTALVVVFPLRQIVQDSGPACATPSVLMFALPLFVAWLLFLVIDVRHRPTPAGAGSGG